MKAIIDLVLLGILIVCVWSGYKKGILMGIGGILCIIVSIYGANLAANLFSYDVVPALKPFAEGYTESLLNRSDSKVLKLLGWENSRYSVEDLLNQNPEQSEAFAAACYRVTGIDETSAARMAERAAEYHRENGGEMLEAVVHILCNTVSYVMCFTLAFLILIILLTVVGNLPNLSYKIPQLDLLNDIGGAVLGLITGILFCVLLVWVLKFMGMLLGSDSLSSSIFGGMLLRWDPLYPFLKL